MWYSEYDGVDGSTLGQCVGRMMIYDSSCVLLDVYVVVTASILVCSQPFLKLSKFIAFN